MNIVRAATVILNELIVSSSDDEDNSDEELIFDEVLHERDHRCYNARRIPRIQTYVEEVVYFYSNKEFQQNFR